MLKSFIAAAAILVGANVAYAQQPYAAYPQFQPYPSIQYYPYNPPPATPPSWSYDPYTSGLGPCPQRARGDDRCAERIDPTAGQPNYWVR
jgi:hypothetical protein